MAVHYNGLSYSKMQVSCCALAPTVRSCKFRALGLVRSMLNTVCHRDTVSVNVCAELQELKRQYESALRIWGQPEFPLHNEPEPTRSRRLERLQIKQRALEARNSANDSVLDHKLTCQLCAGGCGEGLDWIAQSLASKQELTL
jgi:hypothetical protein